MGTSQNELVVCLRAVDDELIARLGTEVEREWRMKLQTAQEVVEILMAEMG